jgi:hypothetical protein
MSGRLGSQGGSERRRRKNLKKQRQTAGQTPRVADSHQTAMSGSPEDTGEQRSGLLAAEPGTAAVRGGASLG